jgi:hypothetical protein
MKKLMPYLVSGGLGVGAGALLTGKRRARKGESRTSHLGRVLGNALIAGGLTAGSHALLSKGVAAASGKEVQDHISPELPDEGPLATNLRTAAFSPLTAGAAGAGGLLATSKLGLLGSGGNQVKMDRANFITKMQQNGHAGITESDVTSMPTKDLQGKIDTASAQDETIARELKRLRQRGGIAGGDTKLERILSNISRRGPLSTFGQTTPRRIGRGALGFTAAAVPSILGALLTTDKSQPDV